MAPVPPPPPAAELEPVLELWPTGRRIVRCHHSAYGATEFNPTTAEGRFRPIRGDRAVVPTLYGSDTIGGALSETVFHNVPAAAVAKRVRASALLPMLKSELAARRELRLVSLHGRAALRAIGATRAQLIESEADQYPALARWGQALHDSGAEPDGLVWRARHDARSFAVLLFGDRVRRHELAVAQAPVPLAWGPALEQVRVAAEAAGVTLVE